MLTHARRRGSMITSEARKLRRTDDTMIANRVLFFLMPETLFLRPRTDVSTEWLCSSSFGLICTYICTYSCELLPSTSHTFCL